MATHPTRFLPLPKSGEETSVRFAFRAWDDPLAVHYHCRDGMHTLTPEDWAQYMDFAAAHGW